MPQTPPTIPLIKVPVDGPPSFIAEEALNASLDSLIAILNGIDAFVYVADMNSYELLFNNEVTKDCFGNIVGQQCWKALQAGQSGPCPFCSNDKLLDGTGKPTGTFRWEFQNTVNGCWYDIRDRAIQWVDERFVRLEIATDITERKRLEMKLQESLSLLSASLESTADGLLIVNRQGRIIRWNQKFAEMWKIPEEVLADRDDEKTISLVLPQIADPEQFTAKVRELYEVPEQSSFD